ncbi:hypothetical protein C4D60_Mb07t20120 [Musa balbisiana]|uniref:Uncharacterized protein n=1 Tax=Musa balbisiana TaxID=52838 RepID=A0A4S8JGM8_MUSBA|nr:hypothetical protein C4D60_Mb07t20120 [Musa balbisiana]
MSRRLFWNPTAPTTCIEFIPPHGLRKEGEEVVEEEKKRSIPNDSGDDSGQWGGNGRRGGRRKRNEEKGRKGGNGRRGRRKNEEDERRGERRGRKKRKLTLNWKRTTGGGWQQIDCPKGVQSTFRFTDRQFSLDILLPLKVKQKDQILKSNRSQIKNSKKKENPMKTRLTQYRSERNSIERSSASLTPIAADVAAPTPGEHPKLIRLAALICTESGSSSPSGSEALIASASCT